MRAAACLLLVMACLAAAPAVEPKLDWDPASLRLVAPHGAYARMAWDGPVILCVYQHGRRVKLRRSSDGGQTWSGETDAAGYRAGSAANPELLVTPAGILLFFNGRPGPQPGKPTGHFSIEQATSTDHGVTWHQRPTPLYTAGTHFGEGCYEPAALRRRDGGIDLFFANEFPYAGTGQQEISQMHSVDNGATWTNPTTACFESHGRDGMPVPLTLTSGQTVLAIEASGSHALQPTMVDPALSPAGASPARWSAIDALSPVSYAGAPYLRQLPSGPTILSCQLDLGDGQHATVFVGDPSAHHFTHGINPFPTDLHTQSQWAGLLVKDATTVIANTTATIHGQAGIWAMQGRLESPRP